MLRGVLVKWHRNYWSVAEAKLIRGLPASCLPDCQLSKAKQNWRNTSSWQQRILSMSLSVCKVRDGGDCRHASYCVSAQLHLKHAPAKCFPWQRLCVFSSLQRVWADYRRTALMPRTGGLGVVPTSVHTEMKADTLATERTAWVENCEQQARLC